MAETVTERAKVALQIIDLAKARVLADCHFLSSAIGSLKVVSAQLETEFSADGYFLMFDVDRVIAHFKQSATAPKFNLLHSVIHCLFLHPYVNASVDQPLWNLACDIAVERVSIELCGKRPGPIGLERALVVERVERDLGCRASAEKVYNRLRDGWWQDDLARWMGLMKTDAHDCWYAPAQGDGDQDGEGSGEGEDPKGGIGRRESEADSADSTSGDARDDAGRKQRQGDDGDAQDSDDGNGQGDADADSQEGRGGTGSSFGNAAPGKRREAQGEDTSAASQQPPAKEDGNPISGVGDAGADQTGSSAIASKSSLAGTGVGDVSNLVAASRDGARLRTVALPSRESQMAQWRQVATALAVNLQTVSARSGRGLSAFVDDLEETARPQVDYREFLRQFAIPGEVMRLSDEEYDSVFYTYGMHLYGDLPLIEPLEYREERRVREFVIVIDTSASVQGDAVREFMATTFDLLKSTESFHERIHVRILQSDVEVRTDDVVRSAREFEDWGRTMRMVGGGGTDFRPAFAYVDDLIASGEFHDLGGLVYFTDGWGVYPEWTPSYKVAFAFYDEDRRFRDVPPWAMQIVLDSDTMDREENMHNKRRQLG